MTDTTTTGEKPPPVDPRTCPECQSGDHPTGYHDNRTETQPAGYHDNSAG